MNDIVTLKGNQPGPTVAVFAGIHGNERAGVYALNELVKTLTVTNGTLHLVWANPPAIEAGVRSINTNLNRLFDRKLTGDSYEYARAQQLMDLLDGCDALLDLHQYSDPNGQPFIICEEDSITAAQIFEPNIISTNWATTEPGATDGYMAQIGKIGICVECGDTKHAKDFIELAKRTVYQFLSYFKMIEPAVSLSQQQKTFVGVKKVVMRTGNDFSIAERFTNFQKLREGQIIGHQNGVPYVAHRGEVIIFPDYDAAIGDEAWIIGEVLR